MKSMSFLLTIALVTVGSTLPACCLAEINSVQTELAQLEAGTHGRIGVAAIFTGDNSRIQYRANERFPMGCTSMVMGVAAILKKSMFDESLLQERIQYHKNELINWTPITEKHLADGMTIKELGAAAITQSDNTAMNLLVKKLGGISALNVFARSIHNNDYKQDHGWPEEALSSPRSNNDSATPAAMAESLRQLALGKVLATPQRELLTTWLKNNVTGNERIRAGVPRGWTVGNKTGTGFHYGTTNDIAVIWPSTCKPIVVAIYYSSDDPSAPKRNDVLAAATKILIADYVKKHPDCI